MNILKTKRLNHLGLVMGTLREFNIIDFIDEKLGNHQLEKVSSGQAIAAMIINGLGFVSKPLSLTPQFFETKALDLLFGRQIEADVLNRHPLGRALVQVHQYGCELFFSQIASHICQKIKLDQTFTSLDTTTFSLSGEYQLDTNRVLRKPRILFYRQEGVCQKPEFS